LAFVSVGIILLATGVFLQVDCFVKLNHTRKALPFQISLLSHCKVYQPRYCHLTTLYLIWNDHICYLCEIYMVYWQ